MSADRREFLKFLLGGTALGIASNPLQTLIEAAIFESARQAHAQSIVLNPERFYFNISFPGAPPRWNYDLFLDPYGNGNNIVRNAGVATCFEGGSRYTEAVYKSVKVPKYNIHAPWIWGQQMPTSSGGWTNIYNLMEHMMVIQGINTEAPGHDESRNKMEQANGYSVSGFLADHIKSPFNSVNLDSAYPFVSKSGVGNTSVGLGTSNLVNTLMSKFSKNDLQIYSALDDDLQAAYQNALDNLNYDAGLRSPATVNIKKTHEGALDLINSNLGNFAQIWNEKYGRYKQLLEKSFTDKERFKNFLDKPVGVAIGNRDTTYQLTNTRGALAYNTDLSTMAHAGFDNGRIASLFAVAEFLAENKLSSSLQGRVFNATPWLANSNGGAEAARGLTHDQHNVGVMISTLSNAIMYRGLSACLYEFIESRKKSSKGYKFADTVIRLSGDFNRSPRNDGTGSDHGFQGQVVTIFSGKVAEPVIVGRIYKEARASGVIGANYSGSWGVGGTVNIEAGPVTLTSGHALSTISAMLGIPSPANNNVSLVKIVNGKTELIKPDLKLKVIS